MEKGRVYAATYTYIHRYIRKRIKGVHIHAEWRTRISGSFSDGKSSHGRADRRAGCQLGNELQCSAQKNSDGIWVTEW
jgi:hypothetical protein